MFFNISYFSPNLIINFVNLFFVFVRRVSSFTCRNLLFLYSLQIRSLVTFFSFSLTMGVTFSLLVFPRQILQVFFFTTLLYHFILRNILVICTPWGVKSTLSLVLTDSVAGVSWLVIKPFKKFITATVWQNSFFGTVWRIWKR